MESICHMGVSHLLQEKEHDSMYICYSKRRVEVFLISSVTRKGRRKVFDMRRFHICYTIPLCYKKWKMESVSHKTDSQQLHIEQNGRSYDYDCFPFHYHTSMLQTNVFTYLLLFFEYFASFHTWQEQACLLKKENPVCQH